MTYEERAAEARNRKELREAWERQQEQKRQEEWRLVLLAYNTNRSYK